MLPEICPYTYSSGIYECYLIWKNGFLQTYELNDIKERRLFWIILAGSKCHSKCPYKRQAEGDQIHREEEAIQKWRQKLD